MKVDEGVSYRGMDTKTPAEREPSRPHSVYINDRLWERASELGIRETKSVARVINDALEVYLIKREMR